MSAEDVLYKFGRCMWALLFILHSFLVTRGSIIVRSHEFCYVVVNKGMTAEYVIYETCIGATDERLNRRKILAVCAPLKQLQKESLPENMEKTSGLNGIPTHDRAAIPMQCSTN